MNDDVHKYQGDLIDTLFDIAYGSLERVNFTQADRPSLVKQQSTNDICNDSYNDNNYDKQGAD